MEEQLLPTTWAAATITEESLHVTSDRRSTQIVNPVRYMTERLTLVESPLSGNIVGGIDHLVCVASDSAYNLRQLQG